MRTKRPGAGRAVSKLVCTAGPAAGQEFPLSGDEVVIGRAADNPVSVPDTSVSRKHALVRKTEEGWAVSDLGSGNGTMLNGEVIADETTLANDDVIALGDTEFRFVDASATKDEAPRRPPVRTARQLGEGAGAPPRRPVRTSRMADDPAVKASGRRKTFIRVGALIAVLMAGFVGLKAIEKKNQAERDRRARAQDEAKEALGLAFQQAKTAVRNHKFAEAKALLEQLQADAPDYDTKNVQTYLATATAEIPRQVALDAATAFLKQNELGKAKLELDKVSGDMLATEKALLVDQLGTKVSAKITDARVLLSQSGVMAKMEQMKAMAEDVLVARPDDRDASDLKKQAEMAIERIKNPNLPPPPEEKPWLDVQTRFRTGDENGALSLAEACASKFPQCRGLEGQMKEFQAKKKNVDGLNESELWALYNLDKKIAGGQSSDLSKDIRVKVAARFAMQASKLKTSNNWTGAIEAARRVLEVDPSNGQAVQIIADGKSQARDVYLRGYQLRETSPDEAARLFKEVLAMTPGDDDYHVKAQQRLSELQKQ